MLFRSGFTDHDTRTGWLLRLTLQQAGGIAWQIKEVGIDANGVPRITRTLDTGGAAGSP